MTRRKLLFWGTASTLAIAVIVSYALRGPSLGGTALDTTGTSTHPAPTATSAAPTSPQGAGAISGDHAPFILLNPSVVRQGSSLAALGNNFGPKAIIDFYLEQTGSGQATPLSFVQADENGSFAGAVLNLPATQPSGAFTIEARQRNSDSEAQSQGVLDTGVANVTLGTQVGKTGDVIGVSARGFIPAETVDVYWNKVGTPPIATFAANSLGEVVNQALTVPFGAIGNNTFIFVGQKSQEPQAVPFLLLNLYPSVKLSSYALQADNLLSFSGKDFGPNENIDVYVNNPSGRPVLKIQADSQGTFNNIPGFTVPFSLKGQQTIIFIGQQSHTPATVSFDVLPYTPNAQPSTYGGRPGTAVTFYVAGFARSEVVHIYIGATRNTPGTMVGCFQTDGQGGAGGAGSYVIPGDAETGQLTFTLTGSKSGASATATVQVMPPQTAVQLPPQAPFKCSLDGK
ncbi:MAG TPA: hypothetical protein VKT82_32860 [Ktedonobacterales bacterium]|nr:hypothetical protein [Ktedonobacterales bacterium]